MSKLKLILPIAIIAALGAYKFALAKPAPAPKPKVDGTVYVLGKEFLVNLADGRFAKLTVALVLAHDDTSTAAKAEGSTPPEGYGAMTQEAVVRSEITDVLTDAKDTDLIDGEGRHKVEEKILKRLKKHTDVKVEEVMFPDITVQ
jgi:flagellar basal body-associated protein FliL